jgi:glycine/D-amino acid oxidase-like deaminating enzyme
VSGYDALVVGAGVMGASAALWLGRAGMRVALVDRGRICRSASGVNAGTLTLHMTRAALIPYAMRGHALWASAGDWLGHDVGVVPTAGLCLAFTDAEAQLLEARVRARVDAGAPIEIVSPARARSIEPGLSDHLRLAAFCPVDGYAAAYETGHAYARALAAAGVELVEEEAIEAVDRDGGGFVARGRTRELRGRRLILAGGVWLESMLGWLGLDVPIKVLVNQLAVTERLRPAMRTVVTVANGLLSLKQFPNGTVVVGGGWQGIGDRERGGVEVVPERLIGNLRLAAWAVPALRRGRLVRAWLGLEAETADAMPILGAVPGVPDAYAIGSVHSGYTSGPYMGRLLADLISGREPALPIFPLDRLLGQPVRTEVALS